MTESTLIERQRSLAEDASRSAQPRIEAFDAAMRCAEDAIGQLRELGLSVEVRHPLQARQTMLDTRLRVSLPEIALS